jgi:hypothetical protein
MIAGTMDNKQLSKSALARTQTSSSRNNHVQETRDGLEKLLTLDGHRVDRAKGEDNAVRRAKSDPRALISAEAERRVGRLDCGRYARTQTRRVECERADCGVCIEALPEGVEIEIERSTYLIRADNFDHLRRLIVSYQRLRALCEVTFYRSCEISDQFLV